MTRTRAAKWLLLAALALTLLTSSTARAQEPSIWLELNRAPGAESCPDDARLWSAVNALFPQRIVRPATDPAHASLRVSISVSQSTTGYAAALRVVGERWGERIIADHDEQCRGLADALAVGLVLLVEPDAAPHAALPRASEAPVHEQSRSRIRTRFGVEGGGLVGSGVLGDLSQPSFGGFLGAEIGLAGPALRIRALRLLSSPTHYQAGTVEVDLWAALFEPCWQFRIADRWSLEPCIGLGWGRQRGAARDFLSNSAVTRAWLSLTPDVTLKARLMGPLSATLTGGGVIRLRDQSYFIDDNRVQRQAPLGFSISLGLQSAWEFGSAK